MMSKEMDVIKEVLNKQKIDEKKNTSSLFGVTKSLQEISFLVGQSFLREKDKDVKKQLTKVSDDIDKLIKSIRSIIK